MAVNRPNALKVTRMTADVTALGAGSKLEFLTAGSAILATINLDTVAGTVAGAGVLTFSGFPKATTATATGTIALARTRTSANADVHTGLTVGLAGSGADIILDAVVVSTVGQAINITSLTLTHG